MKKLVKLRDIIEEAERQGIDIDELVVNADAIGALVEDDDSNEED